MTQTKIIVIGGGAAGLMAAGQAAKSGADVLLLEKMKLPGRKLGITGKGRCNITNTAEINEFIEHFGKTGKFLRQAFSQFFNTDLMNFFEDLGLKLVTERGGRVFPASGKAIEVVKLLHKWVENSGVKVRTSCIVERLLISDGRVNGVVANGREYLCDSVILATGGASYPATGSTGDGYKLAESAGHSIVPIRQALVPLDTFEDVSAMSGLNLRNINVSMFVNGKKRKEAFGELVFNETGVTGPVILTLSGDAVDALRNDDEVMLSIDLKPALNEQKLENRILREISSRGKEQANSLMRGFVPREMVGTCLKLTGINPRLRVSAISAEERSRLRNWLKDFRLQVTEPRPFSEAIVTAGGVNTREIDPNTMESKITKGLYIVGELLDVHADTGGYNLQAAFSTGNAPFHRTF